MIVREAWGRGGYARTTEIRRSGVPVWARGRRAATRRATRLRQGYASRRPRLETPRPTGRHRSCGRGRLWNARAQRPARPTGTAPRQCYARHEARRNADGFCWFGARLRCVRRKKRQSSLYGALTRTTSRSAHTPLYVFLSQSHEDVPRMCPHRCVLSCLWLWLRPPRFRSHVSVVWAVQLVAARTAPHLGHCQSAYLPPACRARVASARPARSTCLILGRRRNFARFPWMPCSLTPNISSPGLLLPEGAALARHPTSCCEVVGKRYLSTGRRRRCGMRRRASGTGRAHCSNGIRTCARSGEGQGKGRVGSGFEYCLRTSSQPRGS